MYNLSEKVCLIVPCYNESKRIDFQKFNQYTSDCYFIFVNDGSTDNTLELLNNNIRDNMFVLNLEKNMGKAEAVRQGMLFAKTLPIFEEVEWVGYWDADLATPVEELKSFLLYCNLFDNRIDAVWGSRICKLGSNVKRAWKRHLLGRIFATAIGISLNVRSYDSQCGSKIFRKELIDEFCLTPFISRWIFDVEILLRLTKFNIVECPVQTYIDAAGSKLKVLKIAPRTLMEIFKIRRAYKTDNILSHRSDNIGC